MLSQGCHSNTLSASEEESYRTKKKSPPPAKWHVRGVFVLNCWIKLCNPICNQAWSGCLSCQGCHPHLSGFCLHQLFPLALHLVLSLLLLGVAALPPEAPPGSLGLRLCSLLHLLLQAATPAPPQVSGACPYQRPRWVKIMERAWR